MPHHKYVSISVYLFFRLKTSTPRETTKRLRRQARLPGNGLKEAWLPVWWFFSSLLGLRFSGFMSLWLVSHRGLIPGFDDYE